MHVPASAANQDHAEDSTGSQLHDFCSPGEALSRLHGCTDAEYVQWIQWILS